MVTVLGYIVFPIEITSLCCNTHSQNFFSGQVSDIGVPALQGALQEKGKKLYFQHYCSLVPRLPGSSYRCVGGEPGDEANII